MRVFVIRRNSDGKYLSELNSFREMDDNQWVDNISEAEELNIAKVKALKFQYNNANGIHPGDDIIFTAIEL